MWAKLIVLHNPFNASQREISDISVPMAGLPVAEVRASLPEVPEVDWVIAVNGAVVTDDFVIQPGTYVACCPRPQKDVLRYVALIAVVALATWVTGGAGGVITSSFWSSVAGATVMIAGTYLVNAILPPAAPDVPKLGGDTFNESPTYGWGQLQPSRGQGHPIGVLYGTHKVSGQVLSKSIIVSGSKQILNILMSVGHGPITSITDIEVNGQDVNHFVGITTYTRLGTPTDDLIPGFNEIPTLASVGVKLTTTFHTHESAGNALEAMRVDVSFPQGLYEATREGSIISTSVTIYIEYKRVVDSTWTVYPTQVVTAASLQPVRRTFTISGLTPSDYEVRVRRANPESTDQYTRDSCYWDAFTEVIYQNLIYPGIAKYAVSALATDQLSGAEPVLTALATRSSVSVYNPYISGYEPRDATNPAWAAYDLIHNSDYGGGVPYTNIDYDAFKDLADYCDELVDGLPRHTCNIYLDSASDLWKQLAIILQLGRAAPVMRGSMYSVIVDKPDTVAQMFTVGNIVEGSFEVTYMPTGDRANAIEITYMDADRDYTRQTLAAYSADYNDSETTDNKASLRFFGCTNREEVLREAAFRLNCNKWLVRTIKFKADIDAIDCQVGDLIYFQHDAPSWSEGGRIFSATIDTVTLYDEVDISTGGPYSILIRLNDGTLVEKIVTSPVSGPTKVLDVDSNFLVTPEPKDLFMLGETTAYKRRYRVTHLAKAPELTREVTAVEYVDAIYSDTGFIFEDPVWDPTLQTAVNVHVSEVVTLDADGTYVTHVNVTWMPQYLAIEYAWAIWLEDTTAGTDPIKLGITTDLHYIIQYNFLVLGHSFKVYITRIDQGPVDTGQNTATFTVDGLMGPPSDVIGFSGTFNPPTRTVLFNWNAIDDLDLDHYEIRKGGTDWDTATVIIEHAVGTSASYYIEPPTDETVTFRIKAVDTSDTYSVNEGIAYVDIDTSLTTVAVPTGLTLSTGSQIQPDGTDEIYVRATWDANAEVSDDFSHYDLVLENVSSGWLLNATTFETEMTWDVVAATTFSVSVRAADKFGNSSDWATDSILSAADSIPPGTIVWATTPSDIIPGFKTIGLRWIPSSAEDIAGYIVQRASDSSFTDAETIAQVQTNYFVDVELAVSTEYFYRLKGVDRSGNESVAWSETRSTTTLAVGTADIAANAIVANHIDTTELFSMVIQSSNFNESPGLEAGFKLDAVANIAKFYDMDIDTVNGSIIVRNSGTGHYAELTEGDLKFYYSDGLGGYTLYNSVTRIETGVAENGTLTTIPGFFINQPKVLVSPATLQSHEGSNYTQDQTMVLSANNIAETTPGSMVWQFTPTATLQLSSGTYPVSYPDSGYFNMGGLGWNYESWTAPYASPANTIKIAASGIVSTGLVTNYGATLYIFLNVGGTRYTLGSWSLPNEGALSPRSWSGSVTLAAGTYNYYLELGTYCTVAGTIVYGAMTEQNNFVLTVGSSSILATGTVNYLATGQ